MSEDAKRERRYWHPNGAVWHLADGPRRPLCGSVRAARFTDSLKTATCVSCLKRLAARGQSAERKLARLARKETRAR